MINVIIQQNRKAIFFRSEGHLENKEVCGAFSLMVQGIYISCMRKPSWIRKLIYINSNNGIIEFEVKRNKKTYSYFDVLFASSNFINQYYPDSIILKIEN